MGIAQAQEISEGRVDNLPNGRLQFWQFFAFRLYEKEQCRAYILEKFESGRVIKGVKLYLTSQEAQDALKQNWLKS